MLTSNILVMKFAKPAGFVFVPGQFVQFRIQTDLGEDSGSPSLYSSSEASGFVMRSYSIASTPDKDYLEFCTKLIPGGKASNMFARAQVGQKFVINSPRGVFVCSKDVAVDTVFIATGAGVAPIASMVEDLLSKTNVWTTLIFGVRNEADIFWKEKFESLAKRYLNLKFILTLSQPNSKWTGVKGRVTDCLPNYINNRASYFICGSVEMVKDARKILIDNGVNTKSIHFEIY